MKVTKLSMPKPYKKKPLNINSVLSGNSFGAKLKQLLRKGAIRIK